MRLGVVSDVHGNAVALQRAVDAMAGSVEEILCAGDAFSDHRFSNEVVEVLRGSDARYVLGNHELTFLGPACRDARKSPRVRAGNLDYVSRHGTEIRTRFGDKRLLMVHGSPWEPYGEYLHPSHPKFQRCDELEVDYLVLGHTHQPLVARFGRTLVVNPGSLGRSDQPGAGDVVTYALIDTSDDHVEVREFANPALGS